MDNLLNGSNEQTGVEKFNLEKAKEIFASSKNKNSKPLLRGRIPLGEGKNVNWTLWHNNVSLERREKQENGEWQTKESFHLSKSVLKELAWRTSHWLSEIDKYGFDLQKRN